MSPKAKIKLTGTGVPMSKDAFDKMKREVDATRRQAKMDAKVDVDTLKLKFNI